MKKWISIFAVVITFCACNKAHGQFYALRSNALLWATATPNVGFSVDINRKWSFDIDLYVNPISMPKLSTQGIMLQEGVRYWFLESNVGLFIGTHLTEAVYNFGNEKNIFKGFLGGAGLSVGYSWLLSKRWNVGVELGASVLYMKDSRYPQNVPDTENEVIQHSTRWVVAPTKFGVNFTYLF